MKLFTLFIFLNISINLAAQVQENLQRKAVEDHPISVIVDTTKNYQQPFISKILQTSKKNNICMSAAEMDFYNNESRAAKERLFKRLAAEGKPVPGQGENYTHVLFDWPMRVSPAYDMQYKYFHKTNFVDQFREDTIVWGDYNCGSRTYDGHDASDISLWPFWWRMMDNEYVAAVAAAPGTIYFKLDGGYDRNCTSPEGSTSNRIYIVHNDGTTTRYHHLKKNSLTLKDSGDHVEAGEFLGYIGSSGRSTNPHLHFAVYDSSNTLIEPFYINNNCNDYAEETWWKNQPPYWDSKINRVMTHSAMPTLDFCNEVVNAKNNFDPGDFFYVGIYFTEIQTGDNATYLIIKPNGDTFTNVTIGPLLQDIDYPLFDGYTLPAGNTGTWKIQANYRSKSYYHFFTVGCPATLTPGGTQTGSQGYIASGTITSTVKHVAASGDKILYQATNEIKFMPGFEAPTGVFLRTRLANCGYAD